MGVHKHLQCARTGLPSGEYDEDLALSCIPALLLHLQATLIAFFLVHPQTLLQKMINTSKYVTQIKLCEMKRSASA